MFAFCNINLKKYNIAKNTVLMKYKYWRRFQGTKLIFQENPMSDKVKNWMGTFTDEFRIKFV